MIFLPKLHLKYLVVLFNLKETQFALLTDFLDFKI